MRTALTLAAVALATISACATPNLDDPSALPLENPQGARGIPLVLHNIGPTPSEDDRLDTWTVLGHFRVARAL